MPFPNDKADFILLVLRSDIIQRPYSSIAAADVPSGSKSRPGIVFALKQLIIRI